MNDYIKGLKCFKKISKKCLDIEKMAKCSRDRYRNSAIEESWGIRLIESIGDECSNVNYELMKLTESLSVQEKFKYLSKHKKDVDIFIYLACMEMCECYDMKGLERHYGLSAECFALRKDLTPGRLEEYESMCSTEREAKFWDFNEYRGWVTTFDGEHYFADEKDLDFGDISTHMVGLVIHENRNDEYEFYFVEEGDVSEEDFSITPVENIGYLTRKAEALINSIIS